MHLSYDCSCQLHTVRSIMPTDKYLKPNCFSDNPLFQSNSQIKILSQMLRMRGLIMRSVNTALVWFNKNIFRLITTSQYLNVGLSAFFRPYKYIQRVTPGNQRQADCSTSSAKHEKKLHLRKLLPILHRDHWPSTWNSQIISHFLPQRLVEFQSLDLNGNTRPGTSMDYSSYTLNLKNIYINFK